MNMSHLSNSLDIKDKNNPAYDCLYKLGEFMSNIQSNFVKYVSQEKECSCIFEQIISFLYIPLFEYL